VRQKEEDVGKRHKPRLVAEKEGAAVVRTQGTQGGELLHENWSVHLRKLPALKDGYGEHAGRHDEHKYCSQNDDNVAKDSMKIATRIQRFTGTAERKVFSFSLQRHTTKYKLKPSVTFQFLILIPV
jgi:hypothetical protein